MKTTENTKVETPKARETEATPAYQAPRILSKRSLERVTLASTPGGGVLGPGGVVGAD